MPILLGRKVSKGFSDVPILLSDSGDILEIMHQTTPMYLDPLIYTNITFTHAWWA